MSVKIKLKEVFTMDPNSVGVLFDCDGVKDPEKVVELIKTTQQYWEGSIHFWTFVSMVLDIILERTER